MTRHSYEPIGEHQTPRKCAICLQPATQIRYGHAVDGRVDRSSRVFCCADHGEK